ncbi:Uncharacterized protein DAT39_022494 [Clarias magur]|uniref:Uncharacterized protein n=1 Tax=Clarias magur TaxID=1594786 RepID=A0A8J4U150_CLAMG|nr:Uncharacterized protein DAT39_022494 [Clarias magur]
MPPGSVVFPHSHHPCCLIRLEGRKEWARCFSTGGVSRDLSRGRARCQQLQPAQLLHTRVEISKSVNRDVQKGGSCPLLAWLLKHCSTEDRGDVLPVSSRS